MVGSGSFGRLLCLMQLGAEVIKALLRFEDLLVESFDTHH